MEEAVRMIRTAFLFIFYLSTNNKKNIYGGAA